MMLDVLPNFLTYQKNCKQRSSYQARGFIHLPLLAQQHKNKQLISEEKKYSLRFFNNQKRTKLIQAKKTLFTNLEYEVTFPQKGNPSENLILLQQTFSYYLGLIQDQPSSIFEINEIIENSCKKYSYQIPYYEAFEEIQSWSEFFLIFEQILKEEKVKSFELLSSLIKQFTKQVS